jgi:hypothetical protein
MVVRGCFKVLPGKNPFPALALVARTREAVTGCVS